MRNMTTMLWVMVELVYVKLHGMRSFFGGVLELHLGIGIPLENMILNN